jgi:DNA polymerase-3 subunit alpha (Gram-positive type)
MKENFIKLLSFLGLEDLKETIKGKLIEITVDEERREWFFNIELDKPLPISLFKRLEQAINNVPAITSSCDYVDYMIDYENQDDTYLEDYYYYTLDKVKAVKPRYEALSSFEVEKNGKPFKLNIICPKDGTYVENMVYDIEEQLMKIGFDATLSIRFCDQTPTIAERIEQIDFEEMQEAERIHQTVEKTDVIEFIAYRDRHVKKISHSIKDIPVTEDDLTRYKSAHHKADFTIKAKVMNVEERRINTKTTLFTFVLSDDEDSIYVKKFVRDHEEVTFLRQTETNMLMRVSGTAQYDTFSDEVTLTALTIERTKHPILLELREDNAQEKRVELHMHTKMSTLDGIDSVEDIVQTALRFKHKAIAITDHNSAQSFPDLYKATKNKPIKPIYGVEFNTVDEQDIEVAWHEYEGTLRDATYTVFDIETTNLSVNFGKIIEISAIKIKDHQVISQFNRFVNPHEKLSEFTKKFTGISDSDVANADDIETVIKDFYAFFKGTIMVAHNARFDMGHVYENLKKISDEPFKFPTIDTLQIARQVYHDKLNRFNLKAVAKYFKVELKQHHRAIYDTRATADIFMHMLTDLDRLSVKKFNDLKQLDKFIKGYNPYINAMPKHLNVLVANQNGLKNLYKLVSLANTTYFYKEPVLPKKILTKYKDGLLIGSGCMNSHLFEACLNSSFEKALEIAKYYDYIEIQPFEDYMHLKEDIDNIETVIEQTLLRMIKIGETLHIPVVATGDVHHIEKNAVKYRDIYIQTPVVGGGLHDLSRYSTIPSQYFRTTDEMLHSFPFLDKEKTKKIVIDNPSMIADQIDYVEAFKPELYAPTDTFLSQLGIPSIEKHMHQMVYNHAYEMYGNPLPPLVADRIKKEMDSITKNKFSTVYYISHLLVKKSLDEGYLVGSRGSVGSSIVATLMNITEVNPLPPHYVCPKCHYSSFKMSPEEKKHYGIREDERGIQSLLDEVSSGFDLKSIECPSCQTLMRKDGHDIPFETFLGFKGDKVPDIDLNFSGDYQPIVHEYIRELFGNDRAFRAGTISTVADKTAFGYVKGYIEKKAIHLRKAEIERRAKVITGVKRSTGQHPGGIVVVPDYKEIYDVTPVQFPADDTSSNWRTTHFDYHSFEDNLFKLDVLGHDDPTMIRYLMDFVKEDPISFPFKDATDIPLDDPKVYGLLSGTEVIGLKPSDIKSEVASYGVPEMGTSFVRSMLKDSRPKTFADIVKISGLSHGTDVWLNNAETLVTGKNEKFGKVAFKDVIGCRDDIMVTLIAHGLKSEVAFEISEFIRKGKAASNPDKWQGYAMVMREHKLPEWYIWSAGQIKYMFPKAHATAYVMMALRIAWFKVYRPIYFYSAYFSKRARDFDLISMQGGEYAIEKRMQEIDEAGNKATDVEKRLYTVLEVALEMVKRGFTFLPIDITLSDAKDFVISKERKALRLPFVALDGLGAKVAQTIIDARSEKPFASRDDIKERTSLSTTLFNKLDALGAFGDLPETGQINLFEL